MRLSLLTNAEATRIAQAATLETGTAQSQLMTIAKTMALIADDLWDPRLGTRSSGFEPGLLSAT